MKENDNSIYKNEIIEDIYEFMSEGIECEYIKDCGIPKELKETEIVRDKLTKFMQNLTKSEDLKNEIWNQIENFDCVMSSENVFWNKQYYKAGFVDGLKFKGTIDEIMKN